MRGEGKRRIEYRFNPRAYAAARCLLDPRTGHALLTIASPRTPGISVSPDGACLAIFAEKNAQLWSTKTL